MDADISPILNDWPYRPGQLTVRRILGRDGREKIQLRLDLGVLQMETTGRPDGERPFGCESLLAYHEQVLQNHKLQHDTDEGFTLDEQACEMLRAEAVMYYHRYLAEFVLEDYAAVERDTLRNLRAMDFCAQYAAEEADRFVLEQFRPYVLMMCARARAHLALRQQRPKRALEAIRRGIASISDFYRRFGQEELIESSAEIAILKALGKDVESRIPVDPVRRLRRQLGRAVRDERYEDAASLRDQLRKLGAASDGDPAPDA